MKIVIFFYIFFLVCISINSQDTKNKVGVFPFKVEIHSTDNTFVEAELPIQLQQASIFLLKLLFENEFLDSYEINTTFSNWKEGLTDLEAKIQIQTICRENLFSYFVIGDFFYSKDFFTLKNSVYSCRTLQRLYSQESKGKKEELQQKLKENLKKIFPFLRENAFYKKWNAKFSKHKQIFVLLDTSGSMEMMSLILKKIFDPNSMHIYIINQQEKLKKISNLSEIRNSGTNSTKDLLVSLEQIKKEIIPFESELWIFFDSFSENSKDFKNLGMLFKELVNLGIDIKVFQTYQSGTLVWNEIQNFNIYPNFTAIPILYSRACGFSDGTNYLFIRKGSDFFLCNEEKELEYLKGIYPIEECRKMEIYHYSKEELSLDFICSAYEKKNKLKLLYVSSVKTDLELQVSKLQKYEITNQILYKVLLKNKETSFWIYVTDRGILNQLLEHKNQKESFYIGLSFEARSQSIQNIVDKVLFLPQKEIPKLFVINFSDLEKNKKMNPEDVWFFWVNVLDVRYE